jgi:hypothetical protein
MSVVKAGVNRAWIGSEVTEGVLSLVNDKVVSVVKAGVNRAWIGSEVVVNVVGKAVAVKPRASGGN